MSNLSEKDKHSPIIHTETTTLDQTKPQPDATGHPIKPSVMKEIKDDKEITEHKKTGTR